MALETDVIQRINKEVILGIKPEKKDSKEEAVFRAKLVKEIAEMEEKGVMIDIPAEWPDLD